MRRIGTNYLQVFLALNMTMALPIINDCSAADKIWYPAAPEPVEVTSPETVFQHPLPELSESDISTFRLGRKIFHTSWLPAASEDAPFGGLGPVYNATSCSFCHSRNGRGFLSDSDTSRVVVKLFAENLHRYGDLLHYQSVPPVPLGPRIALELKTSTLVFSDGIEVPLSKPLVLLSQVPPQLRDGQIHVSLRMPPAIAGVGLLELVPDDWILERAAFNKRSGGPIKGHANLVWDAQNKRSSIGRFGWKAEHPTLYEFVAAAFLHDLGITSSLYQTEDCGLYQVGCSEASGHPHVEIADDLLEAVVKYVSLLSPPGDAGSRSRTLGNAAFDKIGCSGCHVPSLPVSSTRKSIDRANAYTDLLLHDMGDELADSGGSGDIQREWRTAPLWGVGAARNLLAAPRFLHDGRARNILEAILWHGGEAEKARLAFMALDATSREALLDFVGKL